MLLCLLFLKCLYWMPWTGLSLLQRMQLLLLPLLLPLLLLLLLLLLRRRAVAIHRPRRHVVGAQHAARSTPLL